MGRQAGRLASGIGLRQRFTFLKNPSIMPLGIFLVFSLVMGTHENHI